MKNEILELTKKLSNKELEKLLDEISSKIEGGFGENKKQC